MSGLAIAGTVIAAGTAAYGAYASNKASKKAASAIQNGVQTFEPIEPNAPQTVDWRTAVNQALGYNINNYAQRNQLASMTNRFNTKEAQRMYGSMQPYFQQLQRQVGANALSFSRGELPSDVVASIGRAASQRGLQGGYGMGARGAGTGTALGNLNLRNLGLSSLQLSQFGTNLAMNANAQAKALSPNLFDPTSLIISPGQAVGYQFQNVGIQNEADRYWNQVQNQALMGNVSAGNKANQMATETRLAGELAQAQGIAQAGSSLGGAMGTYGMNAGPKMTGTGTYGAATIQGAPSGGAVPNYNYYPGAGYKLA